MYCLFSRPGIFLVRVFLCDETRTSERRDFFFLYLPCCSPERPLCVCNVSCSLLPPMAILFVRDQPRAAPVWNSYWRVTADKRRWHKSPQRILSKNLRHTETLSLRWGQRGAEPVPTLVYPQLRSLAVVRLSLPPQSDSLMGFYASLAFSPPPCFTYTPSQSRKKEWDRVMRARRANKPVVV